MNMQAQIQAAIDAAASSPPECVPATDVAAPATVTPVRQLIEVKPLNEKAILVKLKRSMYQPNIRDEKASERYGAERHQEAVRWQQPRQAHTQQVHFDLHVRQRQHRAVGNRGAYAQDDELGWVHSQDA